VQVGDSMRRGTWRGMSVGDLVVSKSGFWHMPRVIVKMHGTAKALIGTLAPDGQVAYIHYKHLQLVSVASDVQFKREEEKC
jgi:hypothetical protein